MNTTYTFSGTQNNGKIVSQYDAISGETVQYTYDALNRLASAQATSDSWGQSYTYDGFGNLTTQTVTAGSAPAYGPIAYTPTTNQPPGYGVVDANGNLTAYGSYDGFNRLIGTYGSFMYSYAPGNKRVWRGSGFTTGWVSNQPMWTTDEITFWSVTGKKLATYQIVITGGLTGSGSASAPTEMYASQTGTNYYFGRKLIKNAGGYIGADRLGSIGHFYPYGQEKPSATPNGTEKFTGYFRDAETGNDYAINRYHLPGTGRFLTPDPYRATRRGAADPKNPGSWNRYAYVLGDPINLVDRLGLDAGTLDDDDDDDDDDDGATFSVTGYGTTDPDPTPPDPDPDPTSSPDPGPPPNRTSQNKIQSELKNALKAALRALAKDPDCDSLFGLTPGSPSPSQLLQQLFPTIQVGDIASAPGTVTSATTAPIPGTGYSVPIGNGASQMLYGGVTITINDLAGTFVSGNTQSQAITLLHELGHAYDFMYGPNSTLIVSDSASTATSMANTALVQQKCFP